MATVRKEVRLTIAADEAWTALRNVGAVHRLFPGVLVDARLEGDTRTVTFTNGMVVEERIITIDDKERRVVYALHDGPPTHHSASMQIIDDQADGCRFVWISDFLPEEFKEVMEPLADAGLASLQKTLVRQ